MAMYQMIWCMQCDMQCDMHDTHSLAALDDALQWFHHYHEIFWTSGVHADGLNLP